MTARTSRRAVAVAAALCVSALVANCGSGPRDPAAGPPSASGGATGSSGYGSGYVTPGASGTGRPGPGDPSEAEVRAEVTGYLAGVRAEVVSVTIEDHHLGVYVRGAPPWTLDEFVTQLPAAAEATRALLLRFPALNDVDICGDGPWLDHPSGVSFVPAVRVQIFRNQLPRLPERFASPAQVIGLGLREPHALEHFFDNRIRDESAAFKEAYRNAGSAVS